MLQGWVVIAVALGYIGLLFVVASYGDRTRRFRPGGRSRHLIYPLSLAIYCTSWTFFGSVGLATRTGFEFLTIYVGPIIMIGLCYPLHHAGGAPRQGAEHHLDRRLHRRALRQVAGGRGDGGADRHHQHDPLHRAAAQSGVGVARHHHRRRAARHRGQHAGARRHRAVRRAVDGGLRGAVRHPPHRRHRAPGRPDARDRDRVAGQADRLPRGRRVRDVLDVRRAGGPVHAGDAAGRHRRDAQPRLSVRHGRGDDAAVAVRDPAAAAAIPRHRGREPRRARGQARGLAVPALPRADQPVRAADRARRHADVLRRQRRQRHVRAGAAAGGQVRRC